MHAPPRIFIGVGAVVFRDGQVLLVRRGKPPFKGAWSIPGGALDYGERLEHCALREVREETGVEARLIGLIGVFEAMPAEHGEDGPPTHTLLIDYAAEWVSGEPVAGDDASEASFFPVPEAHALLSWDLTRQALAAAIDLRARISALKGL